MNDPDRHDDIDRPEVTLDDLRPRPRDEPRPPSEPIPPGRCELCKAATEFRFEAFCPKCMKRDVLPVRRGTRPGPSRWSTVEGRHTVVEPQRRRPPRKADPDDIPGP